MRTWTLAIVLAGAATLFAPTAASACGWGGWGSRGYGYTAASYGYAPRTYGYTAWRGYGYGPRWGGWRGYGYGPRWGWRRGYRAWGW